MAEMLAKVKAGNIALKPVNKDKPKDAGAGGIMGEMAALLVSVSCEAN